MSTSSMARFLVSSSSQLYWRTASAVPCSGETGGGGQGLQGCLGKRYRMHGRPQTKRGGIPGTTESETVGVV